MLPGSLCASLAPTRVAEIFEAPIDGADCVEARLDCLADPEESTRVRWDSLSVPVIATCRGTQRGGRFEGSIEDEIRLLERALENGARLIDLDYRLATRFTRAEAMIASYHDFEQTPSDVERLLEEICRQPGAVAKIATMVRSWTDNNRLLRLLERRWPKPVIVIGMGSMGEITRVIGPSRGCALTYAAVGPPSAPGQLSLAELVEVYRARRIRRETRLLGIVGNPVGHSQSPELHNRAFQEAGLDFVYMRLPVEDVGDFFANAREIGLAGFSVTIPHKVAVLRYLDGVTEEAAGVGAVNTVVLRDGQWFGDNTDVYGVRESLKSLDLEGRQVVILGTGGAARAAVAALNDAGSITVLSRRDRSGSLEWARRVSVDRIENCARYAPALLINATPVGMAPHVDQSPVSTPIQAEAVFDMIYNPPETKLLQQAAAEGSRTISGRTMFEAQAARQFEIWSGQPAPSETFRMSVQ